MMILPNIQISGSNQIQPQSGNTRNQSQPNLINQSNTILPKSSRMQ